MNLDYNSFEGFEIEGRPHLVTVRGKVAARDGQIRRRYGPRKISRARAESFLDCGGAQKTGSFCQIRESADKASHPSLPHEDKYFADGKTIA